MISIRFFLSFFHFIKKKTTISSSGRTLVINKKEDKSLDREGHDVQPLTDFMLIYRANNCD